ncbi:MAG: YveK family protein [Deltaproteobacteria bacterium]
MGIKDYINILKKRIWIILIIMIVFISGSILIDVFLKKNIYETNATLYVGKKIENQTGIMYDDLLISQFLVKDYREIMKSRVVSEKVIDELKKRGDLDSGFDSSSLKDNIDISLRNDTRIIEIKVRNPNAKTARILANEFAVVLKVKIKELMKVDNIEIIDWAQLPNKPTKPEKKKDAVLAGVIGLLTSICLILLLEYLDDTIKTAEDVIEYLQIPVIGRIPNVECDKGGKNERK